MKIFTIFLSVIFFVSGEIKPQVVIGKMIEDNGTGLNNVSVQLYAAPYVYDTVTNSDGSFSFILNIFTNVEDNQLPKGYAVSNNFPNPFNPKTRIGVTLPARGNVKLEVFNILGQSVADKIDKSFDPGIHYIDIELNGLSNGFYISRVVIDDKHVVVRKMMLVYGSQHLEAGGGVQVNKPEQIFLDTVLDSLVATHPELGTKTFSNLPIFTGDTLDLGDFPMGTLVDCPPTVTYEGKTYNTVEIGDQCWFKENLNVGVMIPGSQDQTNDGIIQKYCYGNDENNCNTYGGLYQWAETMQYNSPPNNKGICPDGWHIPTMEEFEILTSNICGDGNTLKAVGQGTGAGAGTNTTGFSALLGGRRYSDHSFGSSGGKGVIWTSSELGFSGFYAIYMHLYNTGRNVAIADLSKKYGFSVRCVKD